MRKRDKMPSGRKKTTGRTVVPAGVTFEPPVLAYLDGLAEEAERSRSWLLNRLVKEHARKNGVELTGKNVNAIPKE